MGIKTVDPIRLTNVWIYNPNDEPITVKVETREGGVIGTVDLVVAAKSTAATAPIPDNSGVHIYIEGGKKFFALTQTDVEDPNGSQGRMSDWGT